MQSEHEVQNKIRVEASKRGMRLWRNNSGAVKTDDGRMVRFGLCNESTSANKKIKSSDLIGITPKVITIDDVGKTIGVFTAVEVKRSGWKYTGTLREKAQQQFITLVKSLGGIAKFASSVEEL